MALMRLYDLTGEQKYLDLAKYFIDERGTKPYYYDIERGLTCPEGEERYSYNQANRPVVSRMRCRGTPYAPYISIPAWRMWQGQRRMRAC